MSFRITRATENDKEAIINLSHQFENDFLDKVLDRWLYLEKGGIYLAWLEGTLVGCCTLSFPSPNEAWLQGMRVHPDFQGRGIAYDINRFLIDVAKTEGAVVVRLITSLQNHQAVRVTEKLGFRLIGDQREIIYRVYPGNLKANPAPDFGPKPRLCDKIELPQAGKYLTSGPAAARSGGTLFGPIYGFRSLTREYLKEAVDRSEVYFFTGETSVTGLLVTIKQKSEEHLFCSYINAPHANLPSLLSLLPDWQKEGFNYFTFNMLEDQHSALKEGLTQYFGRYEFEKWQLMEKHLT